MNAEMIIKVAGEDISVDLLIWRKYKRPMPGLLEQVLDINPGLAALGPILPIGTFVKLPNVKPPTVPGLAVVRLWA
jgi:phage tail protein X